MNDSKPWYLSRTIWASLVSMAGAVAGFAGLPADTLDQPAMTDALLQVVTAVAGLVAILGRLSATERIE